MRETISMHSDDLNNDGRPQGSLPLRDIPTVSYEDHETMSQNGPRPRLIGVLGPTASGKSGLGIRLAQRFDGEIVSADSRQVYRGLDIGTAKVTAEEQALVPHHLLDVADVGDIYTVAQFRQQAIAAINNVLERG